MMQTVGKRSRPGDFFLLAILLANLVCGVGLIGALRADLSKDLVEDESTLASSKISAFLWGKILRFTSSVEHGRRTEEGAQVHRNGDALTVAGNLPAEGNFQRIRSGTGSGFPSSSVLRGIFRTAGTSCRSGSSSPADRGRTNTTSSGRFPSRTSAATSRTSGAEGSIAGSSTPKVTPCSGRPGSSRFATIPRPGSWERRR